MGGRAVGPEPLAQLEDTAHQLHVGVGRVPPEVGDHAHGAPVLTRRDEWWRDGWRREAA